MALSFTQGYPEKIGIKINGEKEFRYSDCTSLPSGGVIVTISRELNRTLVVKVDHNNAFTKNGVATLPKTQELEIFDLKNCVAEPVSFWKKSPSLDWSVEYPNSNLCPSRAVGDYRETIASEEPLFREIPSL